MILATKDAKNTRESKSSERFVVFVLFVAEKKKCA